MSTSEISRESLGQHILRAMTAAARRTERLALDDLAGALGVRRADVRSALSALHREGLVDVMRMRPTLAGFALGHALDGKALGALRSPRASQVRAA
jgi:DNA-binding GntR family transcriptional regulator